MTNHSILEIEVINFEKYNPRKDRMRHHYFRLENDIWNDPAFYALSLVEKMCFIYLVSSANQYRNNHESTTNHMRINIESMWNHLRVKPNHLRIAITRLEQLRLVRIINGNQSVAERCPRQDKIREEKSIVTTKVVTSSELEKSASSRGALEQLNGKDIFKLLLYKTSHKVQKAWLEIYDIEFIRNEMLKANSWIEANPRKRPKDFGRFMTSWLARSYERARKQIPSNSINERVY